ncbi:DNA-binding protein [Candidatus Bathyarchaeota archaeon]|nr:DNA-binding protein [Candidatus Bathyarchaeota archaeon]
MVILDTGPILDRVKQSKDIPENLTIVTVIEWPRILEYSRFSGNVLYPQTQDFQVAFEIQRNLISIGKMKGFADLVIAAICIRKDELLITKDSDFTDIASSSSLKVELLDRI